MAQKITGYVKLQIPAGKATPAPPVGPALGQHGINIAKAKLVLDEPIKSCGGYQVKAKLGYEVTGTVNVVVTEEK